MTDRKEHTYSRLAESKAFLDVLMRIGDIQRKIKELSDEMTNLMGIVSSADKFAVHALKAEAELLIEEMSNKVETQNEHVTEARNKLRKICYGDTKIHPEKLVRFIDEIQRESKLLKSLE